ncbi:hypothetical protein IW262DRAFT_1069432 [Armillaria fumosa]|nr:hypothetical protein IW262DRAFT_1069432 [Armillaria fumosa]
MFYPWIFTFGIHIFQTHLAFALALTKRDKFGHCYCRLTVACALYSADLDCGDKFATVKMQSKRLEFDAFFLPQLNSLALPLKGIPAYFAMKSAPKFTVHSGFLLSNIAAHRE